MLKIGRGAQAPPFIVMDVIAAANARQAALPPGAPHVIRMEVGQPGTGAPAGAVAAAAGGAAVGRSARLYRGIRPALPARTDRRPLSRLVWAGRADRADRGDGGRVGGVPAGVPGGVRSGRPGRADLAVLSALCQHPDRAGMRPVILEAGPETRFQPSVAMLERLDPPPDGLIVASPCNPAGTMLHPDELAAIAAWCDGAGVRLISDEIYHGLNYDSPIATAASVSPQRGGGQQLLEIFLDDRLADRLDGPAGRPGAAGRVPGAEPVHQRAAHLAGRGRGGVRLPRRTRSDNVARYRRSRDHLLRALPKAGFTRLSPAEGAFYLFADISDRRTTARRSARACWPRSGSR